MAARSYDFNADVPFQLTDILDLHAVVKHSVPMCADARDLLENGKLKLAEVSFHPMLEVNCKKLFLSELACSGI